MSCLLCLPYIHIWCCPDRRSWNYTFLFWFLPQVFHPYWMKSLHLPLPQRQLPPLRCKCLINEPYCHDVLSSSTPSRSEGITHPPLMIRSSVDRVALPFYAVVFKTRIMIECCLGLRLPLPISRELVLLLKASWFDAMEVAIRYLNFFPLFLFVDMCEFPLMSLVY